MKIRLIALVLFAAAISPAETIDRIVATVDGRAITELELHRAELTGGLPRVEGESEENYRARLLREMIDERLRYQDALRFAPARPDAAEVDRAMKNLAARLKAEGKDPESEFRREGLTSDEVRAALERQLLVTRYVQERFSSLAFVSSDEIQAAYEDLKKQGKDVPSFEAVEARLREDLRARRSAEEIEKWTKDLREKARIKLLGPPAPLGQRPPVVISKIPEEGKKQKR